MPLTLQQAARRRGEAGQLLPDVYSGLALHQVQMRRGHLYLTAAAPGVGKSTFTLNEVLQMRVPTLYFSMDTDAHTTCVRVVQAVALATSQDAEREVASRGPRALQAMDAVTWVKFDFPSSPDTNELVERVFAYAEIEGQWPHLIVVDNLMDVAYEADDNTGLNRVMEDLSKLARKTGAAVKVLHHVTGEYEDGRVTIPLSGLRFKVGKKPAMVTTLNYGAADGQLWLSIVKNRFGPADPAGLRIRIPLRAQYEFMKVWDWPTQGQ